MDENSLRGFSRDSETYINLSKKILEKEDSILLEIGFGYGMFTLDLYNNFKNCFIYSYDTSNDIQYMPELYKDFFDIYSKISDRTTFIMSNKFPNFINKLKIDLAFIDVGYNADNIISILDNIDAIPETLLILPWSTEEKIKQRNVVLAYLEKRSCKWEKIEKTSTIRIFNER